MMVSFCLAKKKPSLIVQCPCVGAEPSRWNYTDAETFCADGNGQKMHGSVSVSTWGENAMSKKNERQNRVAGELLEFLVSRTRLEFPRLEAEIVGNSVVVRSENRNCSVGFILPDHGSASRLIKFAVSLHENSTKISDGRTENPEDVLACATSWIGERLSLEDLYTRFEFIDKKRRALRLLAKHINEAQTDAGSEVLTTLENSNNYDFGAQLWIYSDRRSCHLKPVEGSKNIKCYFLSDGTVLASAELGDKDAAAEGVNLWLDQSLALDELSRDIANLEPTDFAAMFESGDVRQWSWSKLMKEFAEDNFYEDYLPILEALIEIPEVNRFFPYTDRGDIRFSRCSHEPFTYAGMPVINRRPSRRRSPSPGQ
jgi:hypothetical protein